MRIYDLYIHSEPREDNDAFFFIEHTIKIDDDTVESTVKLVEENAKSLAQGLESIDNVFVEADLKKQLEESFDSEKDIYVIAQKNSEANTITLKTKKIYFKTSKSLFEEGLNAQMKDEFAKKEAYLSVHNYIQNN